MKPVQENLKQIRGKFEVALKNYWKKLKASKRDEANFRKKYVKGIGANHFANFVFSEAKYSDVESGDDSLLRRDSNSHLLGSAQTPLPIDLLGHEMDSLSHAAIYSYCNYIYIYIIYIIYIYFIYIYIYIYIYISEKCYHLW